MRLVGAAHAAISLLSVLKKAMQKRKVNRIDVPLVGLQVIALVKNLGNVDVLFGCFEKIIIGEQGRFPRSSLCSPPPGSPGCCRHRPPIS
jgi:DUF1009 family protein